MFLSDQISFSDLIDQSLSASSLSLFLSLFTLILSANSLKSLNLHHHIETLLLSEPFSLQLFVFFNLLITDSHHLGLQHELIHMLDIIVFLIKHFHGMTQKVTAILSFLFWYLRHIGHFGGTHTISLSHTLLAGLVCR